MNLEDLKQAIDEFNQKDSSFALELAERAAKQSRDLNDQADNFTKAVRAEAEKVKLACEMIVADFNSFAGQGFVELAEVATDIKSKFSDYLGYAVMIDVEAARLRREAIEFIDKIDTAPNRPNDMTPVITQTP